MKKRYILHFESISVYPSIHNKHCVLLHDSQNSSNTLQETISEHKSVEVSTKEISL